MVASGFAPNASPSLRSPSGDGSQALLCERPTRRRLEVSFEPKRLILVREGEVGLDPPRCELRCVRHATIVVPLKPGAQVSRDPNIETVNVRQAFENVDVAHGGSPRPLAAKSAYAL